ncbi:Mov34/MPN/PAD-1 family protein [Algoriphagus terrigena]|uniref:Mov34/MPN/PAD-1 family protein n=1 Tax=Algoriphagus terrigena TaxID=344884 RepID=UPI0004108F60|nr:Mov34/MPN/PAD-1 family protein [Algoriphagus terrigena]
MGSFSDGLKLLNPQDEAKLPVNILGSLALLKKKYPASRVRAFEGPDEFFIAMDLEIRRPNRAVMYHKKEPVLIKLDVKDYPFVAPAPYTDRLDFPAENTPHINPTIKGRPYSLCLFRGDSSDWFSQHTILDFVERLRAWMQDAAEDNLIKPDDDFELTRVDEDQHVIFFPERDVVDIINAEWKENSGSKGMVVANFVINTEDAPKDAGQKEIAWLVRLFQQEIGDLTQASVVTEPKQVPGLILFANADTIDSRYVTRLPHDLESLIVWADERGIDLQNMLAKFAASHLEMGRMFPIVFAIKRPRKVINHLTDLEFISFTIIPVFEEHTKALLLSSSVASAALYRKNSIPLAQYLSGYPSGESYSEVHYIGLGAVGSKIAMHFSRAGLIPKTLIDPDYSLPHNNIRNALINYPGVKKIDKLDSDIKQLYLNNIDNAFDIKKKPKELLNALAEDPELFSDKKQLIIDSTASYGVENFLNRRLKVDGSRYARIELADKGNIGFLRVEGLQRNPRIDDLMMEVYRLAITDKNLSAWLKENHLARASHSLIDEIYLGLNCSTDTLIMPDDKVSLHTAAASIGLRNFNQSPQDSGLLQITKVSDGPLVSLGTEALAVQPVFIVKADNQPEWQLRFRHSLYEYLINELHENRPNETGGIFIGRVDKANKIIYIADILNAPSDSTKSPYMFTRGIEGLSEKVKQIRDKTGDMLEYVGEWHTHPTGSASLSGTDKHAISEIRKILDPIHYPTCITVINGKKIHPYVFTKYE